MMARIRTKDTKPEMVVRRYLHGLGYRYRLHAKDLPGSPDIVFRRQKVAVFVHGCFWHRHQDCRLAYTPKSRRDFWEAKFAANRARDEAARKSLEADGWEVIVVWECKTRTGDLRSLQERIREALG